ncbi:MAG: glycosyltransferase [Patescibacteria group bacterium]
MTDNIPKISILTVIWNEKKFLDTFFESIRNQTFNNYEIICFNNGSADGSLEEILKWQKILGPEKFKIIDNKINIGLTKALNLMLREAKGKYIARIDPDDFWEKEKLEKQVNFLKDNPDYGIVGCNHINIYKDNKNKKYIKLPETHEIISKRLFRRNPFAHSCILARTDLIKSVGGYSEGIKYGQDYELWLRCFPKTKFYNIQEFLCERSVDDGISVKKQNAQMWQSIKTRFKYIRKYKYGFENYLYLIEPMMLILTPNFIKKIKRKYL